MYLTYPILQTVSAKLSWSHYAESLIRMAAAASGKQIESALTAKAAISAAPQVKVTSDPTVKVQ